MLSKKLEKALNDQIATEARASFQYLAMASWCEQENLSGCASFFYGQAEEERQHMLKIFNYLNSVNAVAEVPAVAKPKSNFKDIKDAVEQALNAEKKVTRAVYDLNELIAKEKDYATYNFFQFYVDEQREEEVLYNAILDKINLIGLDGMGLYYIDKEMQGFTVQLDQPNAE